jgi:hypothetical protein
VKEFVKAASSQTNEVAEEDVLITKHWGTEVAFIKPSEGQFLMMLAMGGRNMDLKAVGNFIQLFIELGDEETQRYFQTLLSDRESGFSVFGEGGIFDIWDEIIKEWSGKVRPQAPASRESSSETTPVSTARSRRSISYRSQPVES